MCSLFFGYGCVCRVAAAALVINWAWVLALAHRVATLPSPGTHLACLLTTSVAAAGLLLLINRPLVSLSTSLLGTRSPPLVIFFLFLCVAVDTTGTVVLCALVFVVVVVRWFWLCKCVLLLLSSLLLSSLISLVVRIGVVGAMARFSVSDQQPLVPLSISLLVTSAPMMGCHLYSRLLFIRQRHFSGDGAFHAVACLSLSKPRMCVLVFLDATRGTPKIMHLLLLTCQPELVYVLQSGLFVPIQLRSAFVLSELHTAGLISHFYTVS